MSSKPNLDKFLATRVTAQVHKKFHRKAKDYGKPSDLLREMVEAFCEDRLSVIPSPTKRNLYHVNRENHQ